MDVRLQVSLAVLLFIAFGLWVWQRSPETPSIITPWTTQGGHRA